MAKYRAIVSIAFDDSDLAELAESLGCDPDELDPDDAVNESLDNMPLGSAWLEQLFKDGKPMIHRLTEGIQIEINPHD